ncbi:MAG: hypothetical protein CUN53_06255 [Phototrophicales bacterium]|nr:MAG: hypothetical protein CUN53_06255 [Phototrophicales bacterium]
MQTAVELPLDDSGGTELEGALSAVAAAEPSTPSSADALDPSRMAFIGFALIGGLIIGLIGNVFFYGKQIGVSFPIFVGLCMGAGLTALRIRRIPMQSVNWALLLPLAFFALMIAVRADGSVTGLNLLAVLWLSAMAIYYLPLRRRFDRESWGSHAAAVLHTSVVTPIIPLVESDTAISWIRRRDLFKHDRLKAVLRGLLLTLPILGVFALLLASADAVFDGMLLNIARLIDIPLSEALIHQILFIGVLSWLAFGALSLIGARRIPAMMDRDEADETDAAPAKAKRRPITLSMVETGIVLGGVAALFKIFVLIQFAYFFGGERGLALTNLSYAEYARRGFFELTAVVALSIALLLFLDWTTIRQGRRGKQLFLGLSAVVLLLNLVMLMSAWQRMNLYEQAFGFTHLRVIVQVTMVWMAILLAVTMASLLHIRRNLFSAGLFVCIVGILTTLNAMNLDHFIAERNIARVEQGYPLDMRYLWELSADAVEPIIALYTSTDDPIVKEFAGQWLVRRYTNRENERQYRASTIFSYHHGLDTAHAAIAPFAHELPQIDYRYYPPRPDGEAESRID